MSLGIPIVVGPLTAWVDVVPVEGCARGATAIVQDVDGKVVAKGPTVGGRDLLPVLAGVSLQPGQHLVAQQESGLERSDFTPKVLAVAVGSAPTSHAQLPPMAFRSRLFACGGAVWLTGAAPGSTVTVLSGGTVLGSGRTAVSGDVRIGLGVGLPAPGSPVSAVQAAPPGFTALLGVPAVTSGQTMPLPLGALPPPSLLPPYPMGCEASVLIGGIIDGAEVSLTRQSDGLSVTATFELDELWFDLPNSFPAVGDRVEVHQQMPHCQIEPSLSLIADIGAATGPPAITIEPPCAGSSLVHVGSVRGGADLVLTVHPLSGAPNVLSYVVPPHALSWDVPVPPLPAGGTIDVALKVCGFTVSTSGPAVDDAQPAPPDVAEPLFSCGRAVSVKTRKGAYVEAWADLGNGPMQISGRRRAHRDLETVNVSPFLSVPEAVWVHQISCGGLVQDCPPRETVPHPPIDVLDLLEPLISDQRAVLPTNVLSGAHVTVWSEQPHVGQQLIGKRDVTAVDPAVRLVRPLTTDDRVWAVQELCGEGPEGSNQHQYPVMPGVKIFALPAPVEQQSAGKLDGKFIVHSAEFACRFVDGSWVLFADVEDTDTGYDCSAVLGASLNLPSPLVFGEMIDLDLAATGNGLPIGLASLGYPSRATVTKRGKYAPLQNPAFWTEVLAATAKWNTNFVAWRNYPAPPDKPEWVEGEGAPPDPLFDPYGDLGGGDGD